MQDSVIKRIPSSKVRIREIVEGEFVRTEGWEPSYILTPGGRKVSRVNIMAVAVSAAEGGDIMAIDDGSGTISLRVFGGERFPKDIFVGDIVHIIGRTRKYGEEVFIAPEAIRKLSDRRWLDARKLELEIQDLSHEISGDEETRDMEAVDGKPNSPEGMGNTGEKRHAAKGNSAEGSQGQASEKNEKNAGQDEESPAQKVYGMIKSLDRGKGADTDEVIEKSGLENCQRVIQTLLEEGEIFEIRPGKLKVLE
jgi:RPA family protein